MNIVDQAYDLSRPPVIVAELSANHNGSLTRALEIIDAAADAGADAIKFQTYTADTMTIDCAAPDFQIDDPQSLWKGYNLYSLYQQAHTPWEWHAELFSHARNRGLEPFSAPFDVSAVEFLLGFDISCLKIASFENEDVALLEAAAKTGKPIIISSGMSTSASLTQAVETLRRNGASRIVVLKCCSAYPAPFSEMHLRQIPEIARILNVAAGLSDHTMGSAVPVAATALGARMIEKHLTLRRSDGGFDSAFSLEPEEFKHMADSVRNAWQALGSTQPPIGEHETKSLRFKRSIYVTQKIAPGEAFTSENIRVIRPGFGMEPKCFADVLGKSAAVALERGTALRREHIKPK